MCTFIHILCVYRSILIHILIINMHSAVGMPEGYITYLYVCIYMHRSVYIRMDFTYTSAWPPCQDVVCSGALEGNLAYLTIPVAFLGWS